MRSLNISQTNNFGEFWQFFGKLWRMFGEAGRRLLPPITLDSFGRFWQVLAGQGVEFDDYAR